MKKQTIFKVFIAVLAVGLSINTQYSFSYYYKQPTESNAGVPFSMKNISDWKSRTIASFFDAEGDLKKDDLYGYLGSGKIATGSTTVDSDSLAGSVRIPIFVENLLKSKDAFFSNGGTQKQFNDFMNALLLHGNMSTHRLCLIPGVPDDARPCPQCKFKPELLLPLFVEAVQYDAAETSKMKNHTLAAIILNFITYQVVNKDEITEVNNFINGAAITKTTQSTIQNLSITQLDLRIRSLRALLSYAIQIKKGETPQITDIRYKNTQDESAKKALKDALNIAKKLTEKFINDGLVDVKILQDETYVNQIREYLKILPSKIQDLEKDLSNIKTKLNLATEKRKPKDEIELLEKNVEDFTNQLQNAKADKLYYENTRGGALFYYDYLKEYRERIDAIEQLLKGDTDSEKEEKRMLKNFAQQLHDLIPASAIGITETQASSANKDTQTSSTAAARAVFTQQKSSGVASLLPKNPVPAAKKLEFFPTASSAAEAARPADTEIVTARAAGASERDTSVRGNVGGARAMFENSGKNPVVPVITTVPAAPAKKTPPAVASKPAPKAVQTAPAVTEPVRPATLEVIQPAAAASVTMPEFDESVVDALDEDEDNQDDQNDQDLTALRKRRKEREERRRERAEKEAKINQELKEAAAASAAEESDADEVFLKYGVIGAPYSLTKVCADKLTDMNSIKNTLKIDVLSVNNLYNAINNSHESIQKKNLDIDFSVYLFWIYVFAQNAINNFNKDAENKIPELTLSLIEKMKLEQGTIFNADNKNALLIADAIENLQWEDNFEFMNAKFKNYIENFKENIAKQ